jgi:hypothetical protein
MENIFLNAMDAGRGRQKSKGKYQKAKVWNLVFHEGLSAALLPFDICLLTFAFHKMFIRPARGLLTSSFAPFATYPGLLLPA